jgi:uncharacterized delta-60 repeat protein
MGLISFSDTYLKNNEMQIPHSKKSFYCPYKQEYIDKFLMQENRRMALKEFNYFEGLDNIFLDKTVLGLNFKRLNNYKEVDAWLRFNKRYFYNDLFGKIKPEKNNNKLKEEHLFNFEEEKAQLSFKTSEPLKDSLVVEWIRDYSSGDRIPSIEYISSITIDDSNNIYITGSSVSSSLDFDIVTIKYNKYGKQEWISRYDGPDKLDDYAVAIAVDKLGNVFVTGYSYSLNGSKDYATVKYNSNGSQEWVMRYNGPANGSDVPVAIAVDELGNVYITGTSDGSTSISEIVTIKYTNLGVQKWVGRFSGPEKLWDGATGLALDKFGNVYVTGKIESLVTGYDFAIIKYNSNGSFQWVKTYSSPGKQDDAPSAIVVDNSGNIYVTGISVGANGNNDFITIKYNSAGIQQWVANYNGPSNNNDIAKGIAIDDSGNVYVTGDCYNQLTSYDITTIKYNSAGIEQWVRDYRGPGWDGVNSISVDKSGNVFITGYYYSLETNDDFITIKYNSFGVQEWGVRFNGIDNDADGAVAIAVDKEGDVFVIGDSYSLESDFDFIIIKYDGFFGVEEWSSRYNGPGFYNNRIRSLTIDNYGNIYVIGISYSSLTGFDYITIKYNALGEQQWVAKYDGPGHYHDIITSIAVDSLCNVYVTGYSYGWGTEFDYATIKYNSDGIQQWVARYNGQGTFGDAAFDIAIDKFGNVFVTGITDNFDSGTDITTLKYNSDGVLLWKEDFNGPTNSFDAPNAITVDETGNVYITGVISTSYMSFGCVTIKYKSDGTIEWVHQYNKSSEDIGLSITSDNQGYIYVLGATEDLYFSSDDFFVIKFDTLGNEIWFNKFRFYANSRDYASSFVLDKSNSVIITGFYRIMSYYDYLTVKYDKSGKLQWIQTYNGPGDNIDRAYSITTDNSGNVYVTGESFGLNTGTDFATIKYDPKGFRKLVLRYDGPQSNWDYANNVAVDGLGNIYVAGSAIFEDGYRIVVIKYKPIFTSLEEKPKVPQKFILDQNYPNPFNNSTVMGYHLPVLGKVSLKIFNILGEVVDELVNKEQPAGDYSVIWQPTFDIGTGVYFYRIEVLPLNDNTKSFIETKKLIFLK